MQSIPLTNIQGHRRRQSKTLETFVSDVNSIYAEVAVGQSTSEVAGVTFTTPQSVHELGMQWNTTSCVSRGKKITRPTEYTDASYADSEAAKSGLLWELEAYQSVWDEVYDERKKGSTYFSDQSEPQPLENYT